ncbi:ABC transporter permease subunit [Cytobacillus firmus]|uniref:ABC transporter permease subunit n=1 Tax=Cytobacillus firmus TaxID=1399 RepID=UPI0030021DE4
MNLLIFEYKKILKRRKSIIIFLLLISLVCVLLFVNHRINKTIDASKAEEYGLKISSINDAVNSLPDNDENNERLKNIEKEYKSEVNLLEKQIVALKNGDWKEELKIQILIDKSHLESLKNGEAIGGEPITVIESRIGLNEQLLSKGIKPINEKFATQGIYFLKTILNILMGFLGIFIIIFIVGDVLAVEFDKGTIKFLYTNPISKNTIINSKTIVALSISLFIILTVGFIAFLLGSVFWGIGSLNYPIPIYKQEVITYMDIFQFLMLSAVLFFFVLVFFVCFVIFLSIITNSSLLAISLTIIISAVLFLGVNNFGYFASISHLLPFSYINTFKIIDGSAASLLNNSNLTLQFGIFVLLLSSILIHFTSLTLSRRKEIY